MPVGTSRAGAPVFQESVEIDQFEAKSTPVPQLHRRDQALSRPAPHRLEVTPIAELAYAGDRRGLSVQAVHTEIGDC